MFNKKFDSLHESVAKVMADNQIRRNVEAALNEEIGIFNKKALPHEYHAEYDNVLASRIDEALKGNQHKIDADGDKKITGRDFKLLGNKKPQGADYAAAARKKRLDDNGRMDEGKMKDIATEKSEKERLEKMEEQEVNTAGKSDKMASAPATVTTLKPLNKPGLPKLGGMTVAQKGVMKEEEALDEAKMPDNLKRAMIKRYGSGRVSVDTKNGMIRHKDKSGETNSHTYDPNKKQPIGRHVGTMTVDESARETGVAYAKAWKAKKLEERMTGLAPTVQADIRKKEVAKVLAKPNPNTTAATGQQNTGAARIGMTGTKAVGAARLSDAPKDAAVARMRQQRTDVRTGGAPGAAAAAARPAPAPKPAATAPKPAGATATGPKLGNQIVMRGKQAFKGSVVKGADGTVRNQNFAAAAGGPMGPKGK